MKIKNFFAKIMFVLMFVSIAGSSALAVRDGEYIADGEYSAAIEAYKYKKRQDR